MEATELFENTMDWLREHYEEYHFFTERDVVWTIQTKLINEVIRKDLPYFIFNDYAPSKGQRPDLVILAEDGSVIVNAEFKYEPSEGRRAFSRVMRLGVLQGRLQRLRFPLKKESSIGPRHRVVAWANIEKDIERAKEYVEHGEATAAYSIFIDEGGRFRRKAACQGSEWRDWGAGRQVLWSKFAVS